MKRLVLVFLVASLIAASSVTGYGDERSGAGVTRSVRHAALGLLTVYSFRFDPSTVVMRLLLPPKPGDLLPVREMEGCAAAEVCVNGSFFTEANRGIGLLVSDGRVLQPVKDISWGIFWVGRNGKAHIQRRQAFEKEVGLGDVQFAVQSGPTVMWDGVIRQDLGRGVARRTAVGLSGDGTVTLMVYPWPVSLREMARFARDTMGVSTLMNLDGGGSTQVFVPGDRSMRVNGEPVAVGIGVFQRQ